MFKGSHFCIGSKDQVWMDRAVLKDLHREAGFYCMTTVS